MITNGYSNPKSTTVSLKKGSDVTVLKLSHAGVLYIQREIIAPREIWPASLYLATSPLFIFFIVFK